MRKPELDVRAPLDDTEQRLAGFFGLKAALCRASRASNGVAKALGRRVPRRTDVQLHGDVGAQEALNPHAFFGRKQEPRAVQVGRELEASFAETHALGKRKRLIATRIGRDRVGPARKFVKPSVS